MDGALIIDKPAGMTSHDVVGRVRKLLSERRVGHTGTLDPFATGVLVVLVGHATRLAQFLSGADKEYEAVIRLGFATDTGDVTGKRIVPPSPQAETGSAGDIGEPQPHPQSLPTRGEGRIPNLLEIESAMRSLTGEIEQVPPMYSAKKVAGRKLYEYARRGDEIKRQPVRVSIHEFGRVSPVGALLEMNETGSADLRARVVCSAGTYVRTLAEDLGKKLGTAAHLAELRRTRAGRFTIQNAITLEELAESASGGLLKDAVVSPHDLLDHFPSVDLDDAAVRRTRHGIDLVIDGRQADEWGHGVPIRMAAGGELIAVGRFDATARVIHPSVVLANG